MITKHIGGIDVNVRYVSSVEQKTVTTRWNCNAEDRAPRLRAGVRGPVEELWGSAILRAQFSPPQPGRYPRACSPTWRAQRGPGCPFIESGCWMTFTNHPATFPKQCRGSESAIKGRAKAKKRHKCIHKSSSCQLPIGITRYWSLF